jgi:SAM-dependent methyltransferase
VKQQSAASRPAHRYDALFYEYQQSGAYRSARAVLPFVVESLDVSSILDVGCGAGAWLAAYRDLGVDQNIGIDGEYVDRSALLIERSRFLAMDISSEFDLGRQFDLVQCLEVAEHIDPRASATLVSNLVRHGKQILFSAAVPGQGGEEHINERPYAFWREHFAVHRYRLFDFIRPKIQTRHEIEPWYRYNLLFFCHDDNVSGLSGPILATRVPEDLPIKDYSPIHYRLRKATMRMLPTSAITALAILEHRVAVGLRRDRSRR